jgi:hypothetical protein
MEALAVAEYKSERRGLELLGKEMMVVTKAANVQEEAVVKVLLAQMVVPVLQVVEEQGQLVILSQQVQT